MRTKAGAEGDSGAHSGSVRLADITQAAPATRRVWAITALIVLLAYWLAAYQLSVCASLAMTGMYSVFPDFLSNLGRTSSSPFDNGYISAGMACLTTLPAFAAMIWCGWQRGSRAGLSLIMGPALVIGAVGILALDTAAGPHVAPQARRWPNAADLFDDLTRVSWTVFMIFGGFAAATHLVRRYRRHTELDSA
jgi:hypothetical protein